MTLWTFLFCIHLSHISWMSILSSYWLWRQILLRLFRNNIWKTNRSFVTLNRIRKHMMCLVLQLSFSNIIIKIHHLPFWRLWGSPYSLFRNFFSNFLRRKCVSRTHWRNHLSFSHVLYYVSRRLGFLCLWFLYCFRLLLILSLKLSFSKLSWNIRRFHESFFKNNIWFLRLSRFCSVMWVFRSSDLICWCLLWRWLCNSCLISLFLFRRR